MDQSWAAANDYCQSLGGGLVGINSPEDNQAAWKFGSAATMAYG